MKIKFQADEDFNENVVQAVRQYNRSIDFQTSSEVNIKGLSDLEVLAFAASEGRILVSYDRRTMPHHFADFITTQTSSGLVIISRNVLLSQAVDELILIWEAPEAEEYIDRVVTIPM
jgi:hypothetical protein